jgi:hypothetical protein
MGHDPEMPVVLTTTPTEFQAEAIAAALREHGVAAMTEGGMVATFRVEAPAHARVMVKRRDLRVAQVILRSIRSDSVDLDWDEIDVGTRDDLRSAERDVHRQRSGLHVVGSGFGAPDSARLAPDEPPRSAAGNTLLVVGIVCIVITVLAAARNASWSATLPTGIAGALLLVLGTVLNRDRVPIHPRRTAGSPPQRP